MYYTFYGYQYQRLLWFFYNQFLLTMIKTVFFFLKQMEFGY